jgi:hypothetical protein
MEALANWLGQYLSNEDAMMILIFGIIIAGLYIAKKAGDYYGE